VVVRQCLEARGKSVHRGAMGDRAWRGGILYLGAAEGLAEQVLFCGRRERENKRGRRKMRKKERKRKPRENRRRRPPTGQGPRRPGHADLDFIEGGREGVLRERGLWSAGGGVTAISTPLPAGLGKGGRTRHQKPDEYGQPRIFFRTGAQFVSLTGRPAILNNRGIRSPADIYTRHWRDPGRQFNQFAAFTVARGQDRDSSAQWRGFDEASEAILKLGFGWTPCEDLRRGEGPARRRLYGGADAEWKCFSESLPGDRRRASFAVLLRERRRGTSVKLALARRANKCS